MLLSWTAMGWNFRPQPRVLGGRKTNNDRGSTPPEASPPCALEGCPWMLVSFSCFVLHVMHGQHMCIQVHTQCTCVWKLEEGSGCPPCHSLPRHLGTGCLPGLEVVHHFSQLS